MERRHAIAVGTFLAFAATAVALNPTLDISQYAHTSWTIRDGAFTSEIIAIAQTPDGYLWLGTQFGLLRFDGVRTVPWQPPSGQTLPASPASHLLVTRDGALWIGTQSGLARWRDGKITSFPELAEARIFELLEGQDGTLWVAGANASTGLVCAIKEDRAQCSSADGRFGIGVYTLLEMKGALWVGAETGLWRWTPGPPTLIDSSLGEVRALGQTQDGSLLISVRSGLRRLADGRIEPYPAAGKESEISTYRLLTDRNGGIWIGTYDHGLIHVHQGKVDHFVQADGLSGDHVGSLFEDREGNIWVATADGLDRFREFAIPTISARQGLSNSLMLSVAAAKDGGVWLGAATDGVNRWDNGRITTYRRQDGLHDDRTQSLFASDDGPILVFDRGGADRFENGRFAPFTGVPVGLTHAIAQDDSGDLWLSQDASFVHMRGGKVIDQIPWPELGQTLGAWALVFDNKRRGVWMGLHGGLGFYKDAKLRMYSARDGLGDGKVVGLQLDSDGTIWAATDGGLSRMKDGRITTLTSRNGLPCDIVHWAMEDNNHNFWLHTACGLVRVSRTELDAWIGEPGRTVKTTVLDVSDGVRNHSTPFSGYSPRVAKARDGKIWFLAPGGVNVLDPHAIALNNVPPPVHVERIASHDKVFWQNLWSDTASNLRLPALTRDLEIDYTALSFAVPEKVRYRYRLEGEDSDWNEAGNRRQAFYNNLAPRSYRFRVAAANNHGVWNEAGAVIEFSIAPAYYQTSAFRVLAAAAALALIWAAYRYRVHQISQEFNVRIEERVGERMRIARDLHDTLLQGFHGLMLRLQLVDDLIPPGKAKDELEQTLERADQVLAEGREAVHDLRTSALTNNDLVDAVRSVGDELATDGNASFRLVVEGSAKEIQPIVRDELYRIAREALRNAFHHSRAGQIEAEITFAERLLRLRIRDDGDGIPPEIVRDGREGHYGLPGIRERAAQIGAKLDIWSGLGAGTEIDVSVPGSIAYGKSPGRRFSMFRRTVG